MRRVLQKGCTIRPTFGYPETHSPQIAKNLNKIAEGPTDATPDSSNSVISRHTSSGDSDVRGSRRGWSRKRSMATGMVPRDDQSEAPTMIKVIATIYRYGEINGLLDQTPGSIS